MRRVRLAMREGAGSSHAGMCRCHEQGPGVGRRRGAVNDPICPVCDSDVPLNSDAKSGEELFCPYCGSVLRLKLKEDDWEVEEEY